MFNTFKYREFTIQNKFGRKSITVGFEPKWNVDIRGASFVWNHTEHLWGSGLIWHHRYFRVGYLTFTVMTPIQFANTRNYGE